MDFTNGIKFDAWVNNIYDKPSVPISCLIVGIVGIVYFKKLFANKYLLILSLLLTLYMILDFYNGMQRAIIVGLGMLIPLVSFYGFKEYWNNICNTSQKNNVYEIMYATLFSVIILKFTFDLVYLYLDIPNLDSIINNNIIFNLKLSSTYYLFDSIRIYNYYDYFSFIYYLAVVLSVHNIMNKTMIGKSVILIIVSNFAIINTHSRLFIYGIYLIPILYIFYKITKFKLKVYFILFLFLAIIITFSLGLKDFEFGDEGLFTRNMLVSNYFNDFNYISIILPFFNQYRIETNESLHNEILEIFSLFGLVVIYYYYLLMKMFISINDKYKFISYSLMFIIIIGSLIQINVSNPYIGIILGMVMAILYYDDKLYKVRNT